MYCPARWIRPKVGSFHRTLLKETSRRVFRKIRLPPIEWEPFKARVPSRTVIAHYALNTVKKFYEIPGLFLIKSSWDCDKYFQRVESYRKCGYIPGHVAEAYTTQPNSKASSRVLYMYFSCMAGWPLEPRDAHRRVAYVGAPTHAQ